MKSIIKSLSKTERDWHMKAPAQVSATLDGSTEGYAGSRNFHLDHVDRMAG